MRCEQKDVEEGRLRGLERNRCQCSDSRGSRGKVRRKTLGVMRKRKRRKEAEKRGERVRIELILFHGPLLLPLAARPIPGPERSSLRATISPRFCFPPFSPYTQPLSSTRYLFISCRIRGSLDPTWRRKGRYVPLQHSAPTHVDSFPFLFSSSRVGRFEIRRAL